MPSNMAPLDDPSNDNVRVYPAMGAIPSYAIQVSSGQYTPDPISTNPEQVQPNTDLLPPMQQQQPIQNTMQPQPQAMQNTVQPNWDDFNLTNINNIVGNVQPTPGIMPDFDFVGYRFCYMVNIANVGRASGVIHSTTRMSQLRFLWKEATFRHGQIEVPCMLLPQIRSV
jgi:hypothetical protein